MYFAFPKPSRYISTLTEASLRLAYITDPKITYYRRVLKGIAHFVRQLGDSELRVISNEGFDAIDPAVYDGVILGTRADRSEKASRLAIPAISVSNTDPGLPFPLVITDDEEVGRIVARHLMAKGYRHFAFCGGPHVYSVQRWAGFESTIVDTLGASFAPHRLSPNPRASKKALSRLQRPLGLMTSTDAMATDAIAVCHGLGWRIPEDVAIVGVDDDELYSELSDPPLSSVAQQTEQIGYQAAECLSRLVKGERIAKTTLVPPGPLIARQSSKGIVVADELVVQAVQMMEQNLGKGTDIAEVTDFLGVSRRLLEMRFRAALGQTPGQELLRLKIERAQSLLATTSLPLKQIAKLSGFGQPVRLSQAFRHYTGQTPIAYRQQFAIHGN
jgi:LacI family transcriptional regulator